MSHTRHYRNCAKKAWKQNGNVHDKGYLVNFPFEAVWVTIVLFLLFAGALGTKIVPREFWGSAEYFSVFAEMTATVSARSPPGSAGAVGADRWQASQIISLIAVRKRL